MQKVKKIKVESRKFEVLRTGVLFRIINSSNKRDDDITIFYPYVFPYQNMFWLRKRNVSMNTYFVVYVLILVALSTDYFPMKLKK